MRSEEHGRRDAIDNIPMHVIAVVMFVRVLTWRYKLRSAAPRNSSSVARPRIEPSFRK